jgi:hypothetical protein
VLSRSSRGFGGRLSQSFLLTCPSIPSFQQGAGRDCSHGKGLFRDVALGFASLSQPPKPFPAKQRKEVKFWEWSRDGESPIAP